jgi:hypothetical protein
MYHRWAALTLVLALWCLAPESAAGQSAQAEQLQPRGRKAGTLGQNYPNPVNSETHIPFSLACVEGEGGDYVVSVRIYNVLAQLVAVPVLQEGGEVLENITLRCGEYVGYWVGMVRRTGRDAASGTYIYELVVDGERTAKKMYVGK